MSKILFTRKAVNIGELVRRTGEERDKSNYVIEKVVEIEKQKYQKFAKHLLGDFDFIKENLELMYIDSDRIIHCILVKSKDSESGILVESEGYGYARYASYYPGGQYV